MLLLFVISIIVSLIPVWGETASWFVLLAGLAFMCTFGFDINASKSKVPPKKIQIIECIVLMVVCILMFGFILGDVFKPVPRDPALLWFMLFEGVALGKLVRLLESQ
jgi:hypothetical protein